MTRAEATIGLLSLQALANVLLCVWGAGPCSRATEATCLCRVGGVSPPEAEVSVTEQHGGVGPDPAEMATLGDCLLIKLCW